MRIHALFVFTSAALLAAPADAGRSWERTPFPIEQIQSEMGRIVAHPTDPDTIYVPTTNPPDPLGGGIGAGDGLWKTDDGGTYWWRGRFWRDIAQDFNAAFADFNKAIELDPAVAGMYVDRALLFIQARTRLQEARADLEEAISLSQDPRLPSIIARSEELLDFIDDLEQGAAS